MKRKLGSFEGLPRERSCWEGAAPEVVNKPISAATLESFMVKMVVHQIYFRFLSMLHLISGSLTAIYSDSAISALTCVFDSTSEPISGNRDQSSQGTPCWGNFIGYDRE